MGKVTPVAFSHMALHLIITTENKTLVLSTIYNSQVSSKKKLCWLSLSGINTLNTPWLFTRDFKAISNSEEHRDCSFYHYASKSSFFANFILDNSLFDLGMSGSKFTWCNGQNCLTHCWARLDHFLANSKWVLDFKMFSVEHLVRTIFDYCPLFLTAHNVTPNLRKSFHFDNLWHDYECYDDNVIKYWSSRSNASPMHLFTHAISRTKNNILRWRKSSHYHTEE